MPEKAAREALPHRRQNVSVPLAFGPQQFTATIGYYDDGRPAEVFVSAAKASHFELFLSDVCVVISLALQAGMTVADLSASLGKLPRLEGGAFVDGPASPVGLILEAMQPRPELARVSETLAGGKA